MNSISQFLKHIRRYKTTLLISICTLIVGVGIFLFWINPLITTKKELKSRIIQEKLLLGKYEKKLKNAKSLEEQLKQKQQELQRLQKQLFPGKDPYELAAKLEGISKSNVTVRSYQVVSTKDYSLYSEVRFRFVLETDIYGLYKLANWFSQSPYVIVKELQIRYMSRGKGRSGLRVNLTISALLQKRA